MNDCSEEKCSCCCHEYHGDHDEDESMTEYFYEIADYAWAEVLKEKIKQHILKTQDKQMTELARIVAEGNNQRWGIKMAKKQGCADFEQTLSDFYNQSKKKK